MRLPFLRLVLDGKTIFPWKKYREKLASNYIYIEQESFFMSITFIVPTCIQSQIHENQLIRCLTSIRKFYPTENIIVINDSPNPYPNSNDGYQNKDILTIINSLFNGIRVVLSLNRGSGELQTFYHIINSSTTEYNITMQDSMILEDKIELQDNFNNIQFAFHFTSHRLFWDKIQEPQTEYNIQNNIKSHTDLLIDILMTRFSDKNFQKYGIHMLYNKHLWVGYFGCACIVKKSFIKMLNSELDFVNVFNSFTTRRERCAAESIFTLLCYYINNKKGLNIDFENSLDGLYYDGINPIMGYNDLCGFDGLKYNNRGKHFSKISFSRN